MSQKEIKDLIAQYEDWDNRAFITNMKDILDRDDYQFLDKCHKEMREIAKQLRAYGIEMED